MISFLIGVFSKPILKFVNIFLNSVSIKLELLLMLKLWLLLLLLFFLALAYILILLYKLNLKSNFRFGVYWDKKFKPHCPICGSIMSDKKPHYKNIICPSCGKSILLLNDNYNNDNYNKALTYKEAVKILRDEIKPLHS